MQSSMGMGVLLGTLLFLLKSTTFAEQIPAFTRQVDRMIGKPILEGGKSSPGRVVGQDTSGLVSYDRDGDGRPDELRIFFGDTFHSTFHLFGPQSNNMTRTRDWDASDGIDLEYWTISGSQLSPSVEVLHPKPLQREMATWLQSGFQVGNDIYSYFYKVQQDWPNPETELGSGLAVMVNGRPPYRRVKDALDAALDFSIPPQHELASGPHDPIVATDPQTGERVLYFFYRKRPSSCLLGTCFQVRIGRVPLSKRADFVSLPVLVRKHCW